ncbi:MAG: nitrate reductase subunit alpha [Nitrospiraceae bacterium]
MSIFLDRLLFFRRLQGTFAEGHGVVTGEDRTWERAYQDRWNHDKVVRSTHGVNCTGSCSWKIYVKNGLITWETQATDYPRLRSDLPNYGPRGCPRGASFSWYIYSPQRIKYPLIRSRLMALWREARRTLAPVDAWASIVHDEQKRAAYTTVRGSGGFVRATWDEVLELVAASNVYTIQRYGPDRVAGFSPIPAMSMVSFAAGTRYLSLIGGVIPSFYDWYCDLPPASPQTWGEQTDVPESADWYNASYLVVWGSNIPQTRTPDAHYYTEGRYKGTKTVAVSPDYSEYVKFADLWLAPQRGTDSALALAMGHVILNEYHRTARSEYFLDYCRQFSDLPMVVFLDQMEKRCQAGRFIRASDIDGHLEQRDNPEWKPLVFDEETGVLCVPPGSIGFRWHETGQWNLEMVDAATGRDLRPALTVLPRADEFVQVEFPYFGQDHPSIMRRTVPARRIQTVHGPRLVTTAYDLMFASYGVDRAIDDHEAERRYEEDLPYTPAWAAKQAGVSRDMIVRVAREFAENAHQTRGRSMFILGNGINQWYHADMTYRAIINILTLCGCNGQCGGGFAHYVGQEKLRPHAGWSTLAFALDWVRPPRHMNGTSFFYNHTDQWRYETMAPGDLLSPTAAAHPDAEVSHIIDWNVRAERRGWLPSAPELNRNPLDLVPEAEAAGQDPIDYVVQKLKAGEVSLASEDPDHPDNFIRNLFIWRSNLLGSSAKGHEYFLKHLLGAHHGVLADDLKARGAPLPGEVTWRDEAPTGKLDLLVTLDFRMTSSALYSDVVLPSATWYEREDLSTTDMHRYIHPFCEAVSPLWESRTDWEIFKGLAEKFSELAGPILGTRQDLMVRPLLHDSPHELGQATAAADWKREECDAIPGKTMPTIQIVTRPYGDTYHRFMALGPLTSEHGVHAKGIAWDSTEEIEALRALNGVAGKGIDPSRPKLETARHACQAILTLSPETNGRVSVKAWESLMKQTGRSHRHLAEGQADTRFLFDDLVAQPRTCLSSPNWSGIENENITYTGSYTNVHELIPWRTLTGRQELYQDHPWMRLFGEQWCVYKPPIDMRSLDKLRGSGSTKPFIVSWITPHQKWGIHSTFSDTSTMLTLSRGGPIVWLSELEAREAGIRDNDWIEVVNEHGALVARAVLSQRIPRGVAMMYHAQEKTVNMPLAPSTGQRGGIHNSVTRIVMKPTHMIGGYAHLAYAYNYYGTVGSNRDEMVLIRRLDHVKWNADPKTE